MVDSKHSCFSWCKTDSGDSQNGLKLLKFWGDPAVVNISRLSLFPMQNNSHWLLRMPWNSSGGQWLIMRILFTEKLIGKNIIYASYRTWKEHRLPEIPEFTTHEVVQCTLATCSDRCSNTVSQIEGDYAIHTASYHLKDFDFNNNYQ